MSEYSCMKCKGPVHKEVVQTPFFTAAKLETQKCDKCGLNFFIMRDDR